MSGSFASGRTLKPAIGALWYKSGGHIYKTTDLSITYHTIAYRNGQVNYWPRIIDTTLRISDDPYPYGWLHDGHFTNHNNYDVARICGMAGVT